MISEGLKVILRMVKEHQPVEFTTLETKTDMCERILGSHLARLADRGYLVYTAGKYTITPQGLEAIDGVSLRPAGLPDVRAYLRAGYALY